MLIKDFISSILGTSVCSLLLYHETLTSALTSVHDDWFDWEHVKTKIFNSKLNLVIILGTIPILKNSFFFCLHFVYKFCNVTPRTIFGKSQIRMKIAKNAKTGGRQSKHVVAKPYFWIISILHYLLAKTWTMWRNCCNIILNKQISLKITTM